MATLLSAADAEAAAGQGWGVSYVLNPVLGTMALMIFPTSFTGPFKNVPSCTRWVVNRARHGDGLALRALRLLSKGPS